MGKASRWFRGLLGLKNSDPGRDHPHRPPPAARKRWSFTWPDGEKDRQRSRPAVAPGGGDFGDDSTKHAIAVAAATAAVAEAAVAAAQAAAAVVHLTSSGRSIPTTGAARAQVSGRRGARYGARWEWAAVIVQSHFRAYLSRRALRALKALVKLQALVRGHLVRKQTAYALRRLQALVRAQARARASRANLNYESPQSSMKSSHFNYPGPPTPEKSERVVIRASSTMFKRNNSKSNSRTSKKSYNLQTDDKILEIDSWNCKNRALSHSISKDSTASSFPLGQSPPSCEAQSSSMLSPTFYSAASSKKGGFTPTESDGSRSCFSNYYSDFPSYMACTESSRAKARSVSAPKQRPQFERSSSTKRYSINGFGDLRSGERVSGLHAEFTSKAYPGSGRLDRIGIGIK